MEYNVIFEDWNKQEITTYNIFNHYKFREEVIAALKNFSSKEIFEEEIRKSLFYYFCSKCEWEVVVSSFPENCGISKKIDVYWQVRNNWEIFINYLLSFKNNSNI